MAEMGVDSWPPVPKKPPSGVCSTGEDTGGRAVPPPVENVG